MKYRIVERPWEKQPYALEKDCGIDFWSNSGDGEPMHREEWFCVQKFDNESEAKDFLALFAKGPRVLKEIDLAR